MNGYLTARALSKLEYIHANSNIGDSFMPDNEELSLREKERIAILEHRTDKHEETLNRIEHWMHKMTDFAAELVKLQTERMHDSSRIDRIESRLDTDRDKRDAQYDMLSGKTIINSSWVTWMKGLLVAVIGASVGAVTMLLLNI